MREEMQEWLEAQKKTNDSLDRLLEQIKQLGETIDLKEELINNKQ